MNDYLAALLTMMPLIVGLACYAGWLEVRIKRLEARIAARTPGDGGQG